MVALEHFEAAGAYYEEETYAAPAAESVNVKGLFQNTEPCQASEIGPSLPGGLQKAN